CTPQSPARVLESLPPCQRTWLLPRRTSAMRWTTLCLALCLLAALPAAAQDRSTPEATVRSFLSAFERADLKQAVACVKGGQLSEAVMKDLTESIRKAPVTLTLSDVKTMVSGSSATVTGKISAKAQKEG